MRSAFVQVSSADSILTLEEVANAAAPLPDDAAVPHLAEEPLWQGTI